MKKMITIHSFKGGTGKTQLSVNIATILAKKGKKVALFD
ncbi:MAG: ParA family protein, partial [Candidatus Verstraetearchaeota archaeon]|nr:ParA family protein [Candidatus Verstraetearchaeota archaeon]